MCGIYGFSTNSQKEFENETLIRNMMSASQFRGPDNSSFHVEAKISLGQNRLSIIDLSDEANQPFQDKENGLIIIFNGAYKFGLCHNIINIFVIWYQLKCLINLNN